MDNPTTPKMSKEEMKQKILLGMESLFHEIKRESLPGELSPIEEALLLGRTSYSTRKGIINLADFHKLKLVSMETNEVCIYEIYQTYTTADPATHGLELAALLQWVKCYYAKFLNADESEQTK